MGVPIKGCHTRVDDHKLGPCPKGLDGHIRCRGDDETRTDHDKEIALSGMFERQEQVSLWERLAKIHDTWGQDSSASAASRVERPVEGLLTSRTPKF
jgi:hypothetical protein